MAVPESITIPLRLPRGEAMALAWFRPSIHFETCSSANFLSTTSAEAVLAAR
jgi:hypothetical protein